MKTLSVCLLGLMGLVAIPAHAQIQIPFVNQLPDPVKRFVQPPQPPLPDPVRPFVPEPLKPPVLDPVRPFVPEPLKPLVPEPSRQKGPLGGLVPQPIADIGEQIDKNIFQPIGQGITHLFQQLDFMGRARDLEADANAHLEARLRETETWAAGTIADGFHQLRGLLLGVFLGMGGLMLFGRILKRVVPAR